MNMKNVKSIIYYDKNSQVQFLLLCSGFKYIQQFVFLFVFFLNSFLEKQDGVG